MRRATGFVAALFLFASAALAGDYELTTTGVGTVSAIPDEGYVTVSVVTVAPDGATALRENTATATKLYKALEAFSVDRKNIKTLDFQVAEHYKQVEIGRTEQGPTYKSVKDGYEVTNTIRVTVCDLAQFGGVLDSVVTSGATGVTNIGFGSSRAEQLTFKARADAVTDAVAKAHTIATGLGVTIKGPKHVTEYSGGRGREVYSRHMASDAAPGEVPVSGGSLSYSVQVQVIFDIKQ